jgi:hypothetical protein
MLDDGKLGDAKRRNRGDKFGLRSSGEGFGGRVSSDQGREANTAPLPILRAVLPPERSLAGGEARP